MPIWPAGSPKLNPATPNFDKPEVWTYTDNVPYRVNVVTNVQNPSIEVYHSWKGRGSAGTWNSGAAVILMAGGANTQLAVGTDYVDNLPVFYNLGMSVIFLRNRLRPYTSKDEADDALQAVRLVRAHAKEWNIDPKKIGLMGMSAGAELAARASLYYNDFDKAHSDPGDPLAGIPSRPDWVALLYPGPADTAVPVPRDAPPAFLASAAQGDRSHADWALDYFRLLLANGIGNVEIHLYGKGVHGDGMRDRNGTPMGTWKDRFVDWFRDLGYLDPNKTGEQIATDHANALAQPVGARGGGRGRQGGGRGAAPAAGTDVQPRP